MRKIIQIIQIVSLLLLVYAVFSNTRTNFIVTLTCIALFSGWQLIEHKFRQKYECKSMPDYTARQVLPALSLTLVLFLSTIHCLYKESVFQYEGAGLVMISIGILLRIWAFTSIETEFLRSPSREQTYITKGPYLYMKHPSNIGLLFIGLGIAVSCSSLSALIAVLLFLLPAILFVNHVEEVSRKYIKDKKSDAIETISHEVQDNLSMLLLYEKIVHPVFLFCFTRRFIRFESIFNRLKKMYSAVSTNNSKTYQVLDMACGTSWFGRNVLKLNKEKDIATFVHGIDISQNSIHIAHDLYVKNKIDPASYKLECGSVFKMNAFQDETFDEIWFCGSLHQVTDPFKALKEASRVLKTGGKLFCQTFVASNIGIIKHIQEKYGNKAGHKFFRNDELVQMLKKCDFTLVDDDKSGAVMLFCAAKSI